MSDGHESFFAYLSNRNADDPTLPVASTRLPTPINVYENGYEFALQHFEITERWYNMVADDMGLRLLDLTPEKIGTIIATVPIPAGYCANIAEFVDHLNNSMKKVMGEQLTLVSAKIARKSYGAYRRGYLEVGPMVTVEVTESLQKLMHLKTKLFDNSSSSKGKLTFYFDPLPSRYLTIVSRLAPISYAHNSAMCVLGTVYVPASRESVTEDRIVAATVPSTSTYFPVQSGWLDKIEVEVLNFEGKPLKLREGCIISCCLHFRKVTASKSIAYAVQKASR
jgi:hypothetical protein